MLPRHKSHPKPGWVITEVLRLIAIMRGKGCRTIAATFNAAFANRGETVSKSYVAKLRTQFRYDILQLRKALQNAPWPTRPNQTWALDFTDVYIGDIAHTLIGVIDHGSRRNLALQLSRKSADAVLTLISQLIAEFGRPKTLKTDNDGAFVSAEFKAGMKRLRIRHQRSRPFSPWENGCIERFFGSFKATLRTVLIRSKAQLIQAASEFCFYYNHVRLHQNLGYRTPMMAWYGQTRFPHSTTPSWFSAWGGELCGWYWAEPDD